MEEEEEEDEEDVPTILWLFPYLLHAGDPKRRSTWAFACASTFRISCWEFVMTCSLRRRDADKLRDLRCNSASFVLDASRAESIFDIMLQQGTKTRERTAQMRFAQNSPTRKQETAQAQAQHGARQARVGRRRKHRLRRRKSKGAKNSGQIFRPSKIYSQTKNF